MRARYHVSKREQYSYPIVHEKPKPPELSESDTEPVPTSTSDPIDSDDVPLAKLANPDKMMDTKHPKGKFLTKTFGVKRSSDKNTKELESKKKQRKYRCSACNSVHLGMSTLNEHYKNNHPPVCCKTCDLEFSTPSTLARHMYKHKDLKYKCSVCEQSFPFESDRNVHQVKHTTEKLFKCSKCPKSYFMKSDLIKHKQIHTNKVWKCSMCKYVTLDKRNLKAHRRVHSELKPYLCTICLELFRYHMQLKRHNEKPCKPKKSTEHSSIPEF